MKELMKIVRFGLFWALGAFIAGVLTKATWSMFMLGWRF